MIKIIEYKNSSEFLAKCESTLLKDETQNNLILGLADALSKRKRIGNGELYFSIHDSGKIIGGALRTDIERPLSLTQVSESAVAKLVDYLVNKEIDIGGVVGEYSTIGFFGKLYAKRKLKKVKLIMHQGVYQLDKLIKPEMGACKVKVATIDNLEQVKEFIHGFMDDCFPSELDNKNQIEVMAKRHIEHEVLYLLENNQNKTVAMACNNRETRNSGCVSLVYTLPEFRGCGYGSLITACVSEQILNDGKLFCNLFTDLKNPTSNSIYQKIGYYKIAESQHLSFLP